MRGGGICLQKKFLDPRKLFGVEIGEEDVSLHQVPNDGLLIGDVHGHVVKMAL